MADSEKQEFLKILIIIYFENYLPSKLLIKI
jgi:hypothetical protein